MELKGAGGTPGGIGEFFMGVLMASYGAYLILENTTVSSHWSMFSWGGHNHDNVGPVLGLFFLGLLFVFFNGGSRIGWILTGLSVALIFWGIFANLRIYFQPQSLLYTLMEIGLLACGLGMIARAIRDHGGGEAAPGGLDA